MLGKFKEQQVSMAGAELGGVVGRASFMGEQPVLKAPHLG